MIYRSLAPLAVILLLAGCAKPGRLPQSSSFPEKEEPLPAKPVTVLKLTDAGLTVQAPQGWSFSPEPPENAAWILQPVSSRQDLPAIVLQSRKVGPDMTLEVAVSSYARFLGPDVEEKEMLVDEAFRLPVHDIPAYEIRYHGRVRDQPVTCSHIIFLNQDCVVVITQMTKKEEFDELLPVVRSLLENLALD